MKRGGLMAPPLMAQGLLGLKPLDKGRHLGGSGEVQVTSGHGHFGPATFPRPPKAIGMAKHRKRCSVSSGTREKWTEVSMRLCHMPLGWLHRLYQN